MSAIVGIFGAANPPAEDVPTAMLAAMARRGADVSVVGTAAQATLAVARYAWEVAPDFGGAAKVVEQEGVWVVADASLYYRSALLRALRRVDEYPSGSAPAHLILAAYRAWGTRCAEHLEGDFVFILWDEAQQRALCARDFSGKRPLFVAEVGNALLVASTPGGLLAHPACPSHLNWAAVASDAAGLFAATAAESCYRAIRPIPAGSNLVWRQGQISWSRNWTPPRITPRGDLPFEAAAEHLRELLRRAVAERSPEHGPASVWMSGGWDSTAAFGAGMHAATTNGTEAPLPVSISYPLGDPGREDEWIRAIADRWKQPVHWISIAEIPLLERAQEGAALRDEPFAHTFEMWNRALASGSRSVGARVALDGMGGDQLFQVSWIYMADLFRQGRWRAVAREWKAKGLVGSGAANFFRWIVQPILPPRALSAVAVAARRQPPSGYLDRWLPDWFQPDFVARYNLLGREQEFTPPTIYRELAAQEMFWYLAQPYAARIVQHLAGFALEEGVELRSPLYDARVIRFAASRPRSERSSGTETKRLLRAAMRGLLPDEVLAPRPLRTGLTGAYFHRSFRRKHSEFVARVLQSPLQLADAGIVDPAKLRTAWDDYRFRGQDRLGVNLFFTFQVELWLRGRC